MGATLPLGRTRSLAMAGTGDRAVVEKIHFEAVRSRCRELGIDEGDVLVCEERGADTLLLTHPSGRTVEVPLEYASYISTRLDATARETAPIVPQGVRERGRWLRPHWTGPEQAGRRSPGTR